MTTSPKRLDRIDIGILNQLQQNARITNAELAQAVNLSQTHVSTGFARSKNWAFSSSR